MENKFIVPQFIDSEDRIWGPITVRQFILLVVGGLFIFLSYKLSDFALFIFQTVLIAIFVGTFAFLKVNGAPFHMFILNLIDTLTKPRIRVWRKENIKIEHYKSKSESIVPTIIPTKTFVSSKKLSELSLIIDTGGVYKGENQANQDNNLSYDIK